MQTLDSTIPYNPTRSSIGRIYNLTGRTFGRLVVLALYGYTARRLTVWLCQCQCGKIRVTHGAYLTTGHIKSCGCLAAEGLSNKSHGQTHGGKRTGEYRSYLHARIRCNNPNVKNFHRYGGRGIEFRFNSFEHFHNELGKKPTAKHSLDRINNDGHYEPGNVRWATVKEQNRNQAKNVRLTVRSETRLIVEWAEIVHKPYDALKRRVATGWCGDCTISIPVPCPSRAGCPHKSPKR